MKLADYLLLRDETQAAFGERLREKRPQSTIQKWASGKRMPRKDELADIYEASGGLVTPNDFCDLPELSAEDAQALRAMGIEPVIGPPAQEVA